jgi:beta-glucanase (GH16 family)
VGKESDVRKSVTEVLRSRGAARIYLFTICLLFSIPTAAQNWGQPVWSDEFSGAQGTPIDSTKWTYDTGIWQVNKEVERYCAPSMSSGGCNTANPNAYIDGNGHLVIQAIRLNSSTAPSSGSWTSARLITKGLESFQYGRAESKMSLPVGPGIWPAFWALGTNIDTVGWPVCGEADYMENVPAVPGRLGPTIIASTLHANSPTGAYGLGGKYMFASGDVTGMHAYGAIWSPGMMQFYVDDPSKVFFVGTASDMTSGQVWAFDHPFFLLLNLAIGGDGSWPGPADTTTPSPAVMTVDDVRVYKAAAVQAPSFRSPPSISIKAGATSGNSSSFSMGDAAGSGRVYLTCATNAPQTTCQVSTNDTLNRYTLDFTNATSGMVTVTATTTANATGMPATSPWKPQSWLKLGAIFTVEVVLGLMLGWLQRTRWALAGATAFLVLVGMLLGCSGGSSTPAPTPPAAGTIAGSYTITVNAYTVSGSGASPDASVTIPLMVN